MAMPMAVGKAISTRPSPIPLTISGKLSTAALQQIACAHARDVQGNDQPPRRPREEQSETAYPTHPTLFRCPFCHDTTLQHCLLLIVTTNVTMIVFRAEKPQTSGHSPPRGAIRKTKDRVAGYLPRSSRPGVHPGSEQTRQSTWPLSSRGSRPRRT